VIDFLFVEWSLLGPDKLPLQKVAMVSSNKQVYTARPKRNTNTQKAAPEGQLSLPIAESTNSLLVDFTVTQGLKNVTEYLDKGMEDSLLLQLVENQIAMKTRQARDKQKQLLRIPLSQLSKKIIDKFQGTKGKQIANLVEGLAASDVKVLASLIVVNNSWLENWFQNFLELRQRNKKTLSSKTISQYALSLRALLEFLRLQASGWTHDFPELQKRNGQSVKNEPVKARKLTVSQMEQIFDYLRDNSKTAQSNVTESFIRGAKKVTKEHILYAAIRFAYATGGRMPKELLELDWTDVDFGSKKAMIGSKKRPVKLPDIVCSLLAEIRENPNQTHGQVFKVSREDLVDTLKEIAQAVNLPSFTFRDLRKTIANELYPNFKETEIAKYYLLVEKGDLTRWLDDDVVMP